MEEDHTPVPLSTTRGGPESMVVWRLEFNSVMNVGSKVEACLSRPFPLLSRSHAVRHGH